MKHPEHICRFNDAPQGCDCYDNGYQQGVKDAIASLPEKMITPDENIFNHPTLSAYDNGFNSAIDQVKEALEKLMNKRREG